MPRTGILISYNPALLIHAIFLFVKISFFFVLANRYDTSYQYDNINFKPPTPKIIRFSFISLSLSTCSSVATIPLEIFFIKQ